MAATDDWLERVGGIRQRSRRGERAPHKPLLLPYSLGRIRQTGTSRADYREAEPPLAYEQRFVGRGRTAEELVLSLAGAPLLEPQRGQSLPAEPHITWHSDQVFRSPARVPA